MLNEEIKNQLLASITAAFERTLAKAGMTSADVEQLIATKFADSAAVDEQTQGRIMDPVTTTYAISKALEAYSNGAEEAMNTVGKIATILGNNPEVINEINTALDTKADSDAVNSAIQSLQESIISAVDGIALPVNFGGIGKDTWLSNDPVVYNTLDLGFHHGFAKASELGITEELVTIGGVNHDPVMFVTINVRPEGLVKAVHRTASTAFVQYESLLSPRLLNAGKSIVRWSKPQSFDLDLMSAMDLQYDCNLITAVNGAAPELSPTHPFVDNMLSPLAEWEWSAGRAGLKTVAFLLMAKFGKWYAVQTDGWAGSLSSSGTEAEWKAKHEAAGATFIAEGQFLSDPSEFGDGSTLECRCQVLSGNLRLRNISEGSGSPMRFNTGNVVMALETILDPEELTSTRTESATVKLFLTNTATGESAETVLCLVNHFNMPRMPDVLPIPGVEDVLSVGRWSVGSVDDTDLMDYTIVTGNELTLDNGEARMMFAVAHKGPEQIALLPDNALVYKVHAPGEVRAYQCSLGFAYDGADPETLVTQYDPDILFESEGQNPRRFRVGAETNMNALMFFEVDVDGNVSALPSFELGNPASSDTYMWQELAVDHGASPSMKLGFSYLFPLLPYAQSADGTDVTIGKFDITLSLTHKGGDTTKNRSVKFTLDATQI